MTAASGPLTREAFAAAALRFVDDNGLDALTMRALGDAMGTSPTAVYRYFRTKDELLEAALEQMLLTEEVTLPETGTPRERLIGLMRQLRAAFVRHPNLAIPNLLLQSEQATVEMVRGALTLLEQMGLRGHDLAVAYQMLETYSVGSNAYDFGNHPDALEARRRGRRMVGHPAMDAVSVNLDQMQSVNDAAFELGAAALLDACAALAAAEPA